MNRTLATPKRIAPILMDKGKAIALGYPRESTTKPRPPPDWDGLSRMPGAILRTGFLILVVAVAGPVLITGLQPALFVGLAMLFIPVAPVVVLMLLLLFAREGKVRKKGETVEDTGHRKMI
jgi:hypothetical protein